MLCVFVYAWMVAASKTSSHTIMTCHIMTSHTIMTYHTAHMLLNQIWVFFDSLTDGAKDDAMLSQVSSAQCV
jgi:hypothetical protein